MANRRLEPPGLRWAWGLVGALLLASSVGLVGSLASVRGRLLVFGEAHGVIHDVADALVDGRPEDARGDLRRLRAVLERLPLDEKSAVLLRNAASALVAEASAAERASRSTAQEVVQRLERRLLAQHLELQAALVRLALVSGGLALGSTLLTLVLGIGVGPPARRAPPADGSMERLSRLIDEAESREARTERFFMALELVVLEIDDHGWVRRAGPGAADLLGRPLAEIIGRPVDDILDVSTENGTGLASWRDAVGRPTTVRLADPRGRVHAVSIDHVSDPEGGGALLLRRIGPRHARLWTLREADNARNAAFSDETVVALLLDRDGRVQRSTAAARAFFGLKAVATLSDLPLRRSGLPEILRRVPPAGVLDEKDVISDGAGKEVSVDLRAVRTRSGGHWVRCIPLQPLTPDLLEQEASPAAQGPGSAAKEASRAAQEPSPAAQEASPAAQEASPAAQEARPAARSRSPESVQEKPFGGRSYPHAPARQEGRQAGAPTQAGARTTAGPRPKVLVIDDEPAIGRSLARALRDAEVQVANGGAEGIAHALENPDRWDLILCDIGMPGVDGVSVHDELRSQRPDLLARVVFMTGALHTERARAFVERERPPILSKPFEVSEVRAALEARRRPAMSERGGAEAAEELPSVGAEPR